MRSDLDRILISKEDLARRISDMGRAIARDLDALGEDGEIVLIPILTGSIIFVADLMRQLPQKIRIRLIAVSSYPGTATASQRPTMLGSLPDDLQGCHVLVVDDILDSGNTLSMVRREVEQRQPRSLRVCVLLRKTTETAMAVQCDYVGFDIPDAFVVGYGLDYDGWYRNLPEIGTLRQEVM